MTEPAGGPPPPRQRWIWAVVALLTAAVLVVPVAIRLSLKGGIQHGTGPARVFRQALTTVQITAPGGAVSITAGQPGQVRVVSADSWLLARPRIRATARGSTLIIRVTCPEPNLFEDCSASLGISVPAGTSVQASVGSGQVKVSGLSGRVRLAATSGSLALTNVSGPVAASVTSGAISAVHGLASRRLTATVTSGTLALKFAAAPRVVTLAMGSGSGQVTVPPGSRYRLTGDGAPGQRGDLRIAPGLSSLASPDVITARTGDGMLTIGYPAGPARA